MNKKTNGHQRKWAQFYLFPGVQTRYALVNISAVLLGMWALTALVLKKFLPFFEYALNGTPITIPPTDLISFLLWSFIAVSIGICIFTFILNVLVTHKMVGPVYAFERHVRNLIAGDYKSRTRLRKYDEFKELALLLNQLSDRLEKTEPPK